MMLCTCNYYYIVVGAIACRSLNKRPNMTYYYGDLLVLVITVNIIAVVSVVLACVSLLLKLKSSCAVQR